RTPRVEGRRAERIEAGSESDERASRHSQTGQSPAGGGSGSHIDESLAGGGSESGGSGSDGDALQSVRAGRLGDCSRAWPQADVYERAAGTSAGRRTTRARSRKGSDGDLVADAAAGCLTEDGSPPDRRRN